MSKLYNFSQRMPLNNIFPLIGHSEDMMKVLKESEETETKEAEPEPTTEVLFLCSHEGCGKTFIDVGALRKHAHIHGERQHICPYEGCGRVARLCSLVFYYFIAILFFNYYCT